MMNFVYLVLGIGLLTVGGEALVRGALGAAKRLKVSPLLSGLIIVGFGTSMPELVVSVNAALSGNPDIAIGNVVGSNIANILLILGLCAFITPLTISQLAVRRDAITVVAASLLFILLAQTGVLSHFDAFVLLLMLIAYLFWAYLTERGNAAPSAAVHTAEAEEVTVVPRSTALSILAVVVGLALLIFGSQVLLKGAVGIAHILGLPEVVIGLTLVAVGTSVPELAVSVIAALRNHADVAIGNVLGSNIFNLLGIVGVSAILQPLEVTGRVLVFDQWVMLGVALLLFLLLYTGRRLSRVHGGLLLAGYTTYVGVGLGVIGSG